MYLEKLEINGFKSFATKNELVFKKGITAVVGPNGSGKSCAADAIRWVLGEQSIKLLRGKKSEDVIFSGSDKKSRAGMAEVSLYLNNSEGKADIEYSEVVITRRLYRSGESEYLINKQKARLSDITMLLAKSNFGQRTYSIIGQGMIDAFLLASPQERKEFFEEAAGVKSYQIKREQTLNKLESTEDNLTTAKVQLNELEPRLKSLTRHVKKLERRGEIEQELREIQWKYYASVWSELNFKLRKQSEGIKSLNQKEKELNDEIYEIQSKLAGLTKDKKESEKSVQLRDEYQKVLEEKSNLREKQAGLKIKRVESLHKFQAQVKHSKSIPADLVDEIGRDIKRIGELNQALNNKILEIKEIQEIKNELELIYKEIDALFVKLQPYLAESEEDRAEREKMEIEFQKAQKKQLEEEEKRNREIEEMGEKILRLDERAKALNDELRQEDDKGRTERQEIWKLQSFYQEKQRELGNIVEQINNARVEVARLETRRDDIQHEIENDLDESTRNKLDNLTEAPEVMDEGRKRELVTAILNLKHQLEIIGGIDPEVQQEYIETKTRWDFLSKEIDDLNQAIGSLEGLVKELNEIIKGQFKDSFKIIDEEFSKYFAKLFNGGKGRLVLLKQENIKTLKHENKNENGEPDFAEAMPGEENIRKRLAIDEYDGVEIEATPPGKKLKSISMLSGGERAMTSIALICSIISANPSPFVVLDEVDAALDEANSLRYAGIIEELSHKSQFIVITHNRATMEKAGILYGVTMGDDGASKLLSLKLEDAREYTNR